MNSQIQNNDEPRPNRGFSLWGQTNTAAALLGILLGVIYVAAVIALEHKALMTDERFHFAQITAFLRGDWRAIPGLTTIPGYHALIAGAMWLLHTHTFDAARLLHASGALVAIAGFHALRRRVWPGTETLSTAQFIVLPILAPYFFLLYTDVPAIAVLMWSLWATLRRHHLLAAVLLALMIGMRQHEVVWAALCIALAANSAEAPPFSRKWIGTLSPYLLPFALFVAFWCWNGSISLSNTEAAFHPDFSLHAGNIFFFLLVAGLLMPLQLISAVFDVAHRAVRRPFWIALPVLSFVAFWFLFRADNPYNGALPAFYLHNMIPDAISRSLPWRALAGIVIAGAACLMATTPLQPRGSWALFPVGAIFLAASWLVEFRYVAVPLVIWLAFRRHENRRVEYATLALWLIFAVLIFGKIVKSQLFL